MGGGTAYLRELDFGCDASYQNTAEFIGIILGLLGMLWMGIRGVTIQVRGDSTSAPTWAVKGRIKGDLASNAAMVFALICIMGDFRITRETWISGKENWRCDTLSRLGEAGKVGDCRQALNEMGRANTPIGEFGLPGLDLLALCNPDIAMVEESEFNIFGRQLSEILSL